MAVHLKSKRKDIMHLKLLAHCFTLCVGIVLCSFSYPGKANSGPYLDSAHGNTSYGIDRTGLSSFGYSKGNCTHCHEQHAMIGGSEPSPTVPTGGAQTYELFRTLFVDQSSMFCFDCHKGTGSLQVSWSRTNYSYSYWRGGATTLTCPSDIMTAFQYEDTSGNSNLTNPCPGIPQFGSSAHTLSTIQSYLVNKVGFGPTQANINPCSGCHDPHKAQRNYPVSRPNTHDDPVWELWGDDDIAAERMPVATKSPPDTFGYMSPYQVGGVSYEEDTFPAGTAGRTTEFQRVCRDCHDSSPPAGLADVNWGSAKHGSANSINTSYGGLKAPYSTASSTSYYLNCTDCHEPHGSRNEYLLRWEVNGVTDIRIADSTGTYQTRRWYNFCTACHTYISTIGPHTPASQGVSNVQDLDCNNAGGCHSHGNAGLGLF